MVSKGSVSKLVTFSVHLCSSVEFNTNATFEMDSKGSVSKLVTFSVHLCSSDSRVFDYLIMSIVWSMIK